MPRPSNSLSTCGIFCFFFFNRLYRWHRDQWSLPCVCYVWGGSDLTICLQERYKTQRRDSAEERTDETTYLFHFFLHFPYSYSSMLNVLTNSCLGLPKSSEQAYIEFESIEAIVKTASRTKFFIEFYSTCLEGERNLFLTPERVHRFYIVSI